MAWSYVYVGNYWVLDSKDNNKFWEPSKELSYTFALWIQLKVKYLFCLGGFSLLLKTFNCQLQFSINFVLFYLSNLLFLYYLLNLLIMQCMVA